MGKKILATIVVGDFAGILFGVVGLIVLPHEYQTISIWVFGVSMGLLIVAILIGMWLEIAYHD